MIEWYQLYGKKKLCCILIIAMSNSSTKLTAGSVVELSISTFSDVSNELPSPFSRFCKVTEILNQLGGEIVGCIFERITSTHINLL